MRCGASVAVIILTVLHVLFVMTFLGAVLVLNLGLDPVVLALPRPTGLEFFGRFWPGMKMFLHASVGGTALFGILLYLAGNFSPSSNGGIYLDAGILIGALALVEGEVLQIFFGAHELFYGFVVIAALWSAILVTMIFYYRVSKSAGWLLIPYIVWVTISSALNYYVWVFNV